jgi:hypothetical protein
MPAARGVGERSRASERPAEQSQLGQHERQPGAGVGDVEEGVDGRCRQLREQRPARGDRHGVDRVHVHRADGGVGELADGVEQCPADYDAP